MENAFYIVRTDKDWYRLHLTDTHYCLGATTTPEPLLKTVKRLIVTYRTKKRLMTAISGLEDKGVVSDKMREKYTEEYELYEDCEDLLADAIKEALEEVKMTNPFNLARKRLLASHKRTTITGISSDSSPLENTKKEEKVVEDKRPFRLLNRRLITD